MPYKLNDIDARTACASLRVSYSDRGTRLRSAQTDTSGYVGGHDHEANKDGIMGVLGLVSAIIDGKGVKTVEVIGRKNFDFGSAAIVYVEREDETQATVWYDPEGDEMWISDLAWARRKVGIG